MHPLSFVKYQGTGNDFVMIDDRGENFDLDDLAMVRQLCDRRFGVGADGLILIRLHPDHDFEMIYYNADGSQSMCGNGSRCAVMFARDLGIIGDQTHFLAIDGPHEAFVQEGLVHLRMGDVAGVEERGQDLFINTGSPHHICFRGSVKESNVKQDGAAIRYSEAYANNGGTNVNFVELQEDNRVYVRTYERGVEDETLSCGTGVTAASLAASLQDYKSPVQVETLGGKLSVSFETTPAGGFANIYLIGPAKRVFEGQIQP